MKKGMRITGIVFLLVSLLVGSLLIAGYFKKSKNNTEEIEYINERLTQVKYQMNKEFMNNGFSEKYYQLENRQMKLEEQRNDLVKEGKDNEFKVFKTIVPGIGIIVFGAFVFGICIFSAGLTDSLESAKPIKLNNNDELKEVIIENIKADTECKKKFVSNKCPNCGSSLKNEDEQICEYCGETIIKK